MWQSARGARGERAGTWSSASATRNTIFHERSYTKMSQTRRSVARGMLSTYAKSVWSQPHENISNSRPSLWKCASKRGRVSRVSAPSWKHASRSRSRPGLYICASP